MLLPDVTYQATGRVTYSRPLIDITYTSSFIASLARLAESHFPKAEQVAAFNSRQYPSEVLVAHE